MAEINKGNILVVDDNRLNQKLMGFVLQKANYAVLEAHNAEEAIEIAYQHHPDVILMDIQLPVMDGLSATRLIKSDPKLRDIPVIAVTSSAMLSDKEKSIEAGCVGHITKPIDVRCFVDTMERLID